jgi:hypothetical protein
MQETENRILQIVEQVLLNQQYNAEWKIQLEKIQNEASIIKELELLNPFGWVPLRIACSALLTQRADLSKVNFPKSIDDWMNIWDEVKPSEDNRNNMSLHFRNWLKIRGNHRFAEKFGKYYEAYWISRSWDVNNSKNDLFNLRSLDSAESVKKWWMQFEGVGLEYGKNIPMDEMDPRFLNFVKIDHRLSSIIEKIQYQKYTSSEKQKIYLNVAHKLGISGWELDRFCFFFYKKLISCL